MNALQTDARKSTVQSSLYKGTCIPTQVSRLFNVNIALRVFLFCNIYKNMSIPIRKLNHLSEGLMVVPKLFVKGVNFACTAGRIQTTLKKSTRSTLERTNKLVDVNGNPMTCKVYHFSSHYSLPEFLKQVEEIKEHQHLLKDLKNSRTLPILCPTSVVSYDLNHYCL